MTTRAVVLARGLGRRMQQPDRAAELKDDQRRAADAGVKALMPINGRPFLDYVLSALADAAVTDVLLIVAPDHDAFRHHYRTGHPPARVTIDLAVQEDALGSANAVLAAEDWCSGKPFLTMNADNLYPASVLRELAALGGAGLPAFRSDDLVRTSNIQPDRVQAFALLEIDRKGYLTAIVEKPSVQRLEQAGSSAPVSMNCWRFDSRIFEYCRWVPKSARGEFELPEAVGLAVSEGVRFRTIDARGPVLDLSRRADAAELSHRLAGSTPRP